MTNRSVLYAVYYQIQLLQCLLLADRAVSYVRRCQRTSRLKWIFGDRIKEFLDNSLCRHRCL